MDSTNLPLVYRQKYANFPKVAQFQFQQIRKLLLETANNNDYVVEEKIKWGQLSFEVKGGTPIRLDWLESHPEHIAIYCHCQSSMIETFRQLYPQLNCNKNREIRFDTHTALPEKIISHFAQTAFKYHGLKHLPLLGQSPIE